MQNIRESVSVISQMAPAEIPMLRKLYKQYSLPYFIYIDELMVAFTLNKQ